MTRERQHRPGRDAMLPVTEPAAHRDGAAWPGKQPVTMDLASSGPAPSREPLDVLDRRVGELHEAPPPVDEPARWAAQQQRHARWQHTLELAAAHRALRRGDRS